MQTHATPADAERIRAEIARLTLELRRVEAPARKLRRHGAGCVEWLQRGGYLWVRGSLRWRRQRYQTQGIGVGSTTKEALAPKERARLEREIDDRLDRLRARLEQGPPAELMPDGREFVRLADPAFRRWIHDRDGGICALCDRPVALDAMHVDHIRPRGEGGTDHVSNLRITHPGCNIGRGTDRRRPVSWT